MSTTTWTRAKLQERLSVMAAIPQPGPEQARQRGLDFESLLLDLFDTCGCMLRRSFHTHDNKSEQIDGAIRIAERIALVEAKWVASDLAASDLFAFLGKVEGKFVGTMGVFISYNELKPNFLNALRSGRRQTVLVIHGDDVPCLFEPTFPVADYLQRSLQHVSIDNDPHLPARVFVASLAQQESAKEAEGKSDAKELLDRLTKTSASPSSLATADAVDPAKLEKNVLTLVKVFPRVIDKLPPSAPLRANIPRYVATANKLLRAAELESDAVFFGSQAALLILEPGAVPMFEAMTSRAPHL